MSHCFCEVNLQSVKHLIKMNDDSLAIARGGQSHTF